MSETVSPLLSIGAGRTVHKVYPAVSSAVAIGNGIGNANVSPRPGGLDYGAIVGGGFGIGGATTAIRSVLGNAATVLTDTGAAGEGMFIGFSDRFVPLIEATDQPITAADCNCLRFVALCAGSFTGDTTQDCGLQIVPGGPTGGGEVFLGLSSGIQFGPRGMARVSLRVRRSQGGALTVDQDVSAAFMANINPLHINQYEMRIIGANKGTAAVLKCLVNNIQVIPDISFAAAVGLLPGVIKVGSPNNGSVGYTCSVVNAWSAQSPNLPMFLMSISMAPNETSLL